MPERGVHLIGVCLTPYVPLAGFGFTLLAASSSPLLWTIFQIQAFLGFSPSEFCSLRRATPLSRFVALLPFIIEFDVIPRTTHPSTIGLQSFAPVKEPRSPEPLLHSSREPLLSWSYPPLRFSPTQQAPFGVLLLRAFYCHTRRQPGALECFFWVIWLRHLRARLTPLVFLASSMSPIRLGSLTALAYFFTERAV